MNITNRNGSFVRVHCNEPLLPLIFLIAYLFQPFNCFSVKLLLDGNVCHGCCWSGAVPVLFARREPNHITGMDFLNRAALSLCQTTPGSNYQGLAKWVSVPGSTGFGFKCNDCANCASRGICLEKRVYSYCTGKIFFRPFARRLRADSFNINFSIFLKSINNNLVI